MEKVVLATFWMWKLNVLSSLTMALKFLTAQLRLFFSQIFLFDLHAIHGDHRRAGTRSTWSTLCSPLTYITYIPVSREPMYSKNVWMMSGGGGGVLSAWWVRKEGQTTTKTTTTDKQKPEDPERKRCAWRCICACAALTERKLKLVTIERYWKCRRGVAVCSTFAIKLSFISNDD